MAERIQTISAGSTPIYEIIECDDGVSVIIREAENHDHHVTLASSVIPTLIQMLQRIKI